MSTETDKKNNSGEENVGKKQNSTTGLEENMGGLLCYLFTIVTGIIFFILEKENEFIRFHALQSIFTFGALFVLSFILTLIPFIGILISLLITPVGLFLWIFLMYKAYKGEKYKLPMVGDMVEQQLNK